MDGEPSQSRIDLVVALIEGAFPEGAPPPRESILATRDVNDIEAMSGEEAFAGRTWKGLLGEPMIPFYASFMSISSWNYYLPYWLLHCMLRRKPQFLTTECQLYPLTPEWTAFTEDHVKVLTPQQFFAVREYISLGMDFADRGSAKAWHGWWQASSYKRIIRLRAKSPEDRAIYFWDGSDAD